MGERKVLNKYIPADFDPAEFRRLKGRKRSMKCEVRMMMPMSVQCKTCGEYMYQGKKLNARKENVTSENYLGIPVVRFIMKCSTCNAEFSIKTDPKNSDYAVEYGVQRNFEPWREEEGGEGGDGDGGGDDDGADGDNLARLEDRTLASRRQMEVMDRLDEIRSYNSRRARVDPDAVLQMLDTRASRNGSGAIAAATAAAAAAAAANAGGGDGDGSGNGVPGEAEAEDSEAEDDRAAREAFAKRSRPDPAANVGDGADGDAGVVAVPDLAANALVAGLDFSAAAATPPAAPVRHRVRVRARAIAPTPSSTPAPTPTPTPAPAPAPAPATAPVVVAASGSGGGGSGLLGDDYGSSSDSD